jgi:hypothetical protein
MEHIAQKIDVGVAMTPTEESATMFRRHMPPSWIYNAFSGSKIDQLLNMQRNMSRDKKKTLRTVFVALDDCMYDKKVLKSVGIRDIFMNGRHLRLYFVVAMQYVMDMTPDLRTQVDYVFALRESIISNKHKLWKYFFGMFEKFEDFSRVMDKCTEHHGCIVLDNTSPTANIQECIFWYKANVNPPPYKMGKEIFWTLDKQCAKTDEDVETERKQTSKHMRLLERSKSKREPILSIHRHDENGKSIEEDDDNDVQLAM